ncbi:hypothetical protein BDQ17DRAFT_1344411 [Cyathus striatus]|nr:hypothetical protein BDQ17DRAFT_1344411 [Cyathus striatus]
MYSSPPDVSLCLFIPFAFWNWLRRSQVFGYQRNNVVVKYVTFISFALWTMCRMTNYILS